MSTCHPKSPHGHFFQSQFASSIGKSYRSSVIQTLHVDEIHVLCLIKTISAVHSPPSLPSGMALYGSQQKAARFSSPPPFLINCSPFHSEPRQSLTRLGSSSTRFAHRYFSLRRKFYSSEEFSMHVFREGERRITGWICCG